ncbi:protein of unknown function [Methylocaldum szegediense]|uniref:Uncharacterized protein n=1 Tax=Methylocaldum szegediense TaxID=73780 RepID=A0ABM9I3L2_9GAMM|nr:protein of unknown function [Methylocaldum szegediense]
MPHEARQSTGGIRGRRTLGQSVALFRKRASLLSIAQSRSERAFSPSFSTLFKTVLSKGYSSSLG